MMEQELGATAFETLFQHIGRKMAFLPGAGFALQALCRGPRYKPFAFSSSSAYWKGRHQKGVGSRPGSCGRLAEFKAAALNRFVKNNGIASVIEFGCGDGTQLELADYPEYTGIDISPQAVSHCRKIFAGDAGKKFFRLGSKESDDARGDLVLSLDVIYHLIEDEIFEAHMRRLVEASRRFIGIYSSNVELPGHVRHIRHRCFSEWLGRKAPDWALAKHIRNAFPYDPENPSETSWSDFYFFERPCH